MTSYERVQAALAGQPVDKIPNLCILMSFAARYGNMPYSEFILQPKRMVEANIKAHRELGIDVVTVMSDPFCEAEGFGCQIQYPHDDHPHCVKPVLDSSADLSKLKLVNPESARRMSARLETISLFRSQVGGECPIVGWVEGPIAEFCDVYDINKAMMALMLEPDFALEAMDICTEQAILFAKAQIAAGADFVGMGDAAASIIGEELYHEFVLPRERKIVDAIHQAGGKVKLHICGDINPLLEDIQTLQCDIVDLDYMVDYQRAAQIMGSTSSVNGNLNPVDIMNSTPEEMKGQVSRLMESCPANGMISGGCEITLNTPPANLKAMDEALRGV